MADHIAAAMLERVIAAVARGRVDQLVQLCESSAHGAWMRTRSFLNRHEAGGEGRTPLGVAVRLIPWRHDVIEFLLAHGCDPNARDRAGYSAMWWAAHSGTVNALSEMVRAGGHVNDVLEPNTTTTPLLSIVRFHLGEDVSSRLSVLLDDPRTDLLATYRGATALEIAQALPDRRLGFMLGRQIYIEVCRCTRSLYES